MPRVPSAALLLPRSTVSPSRLRDWRKKLFSISLFADFFTSVKRFAVFRHTQRSQERSQEKLWLTEKEKSAVLSVLFELRQNADKCGVFSVFAVFNTRDKKFVTKIRYAHGAKLCAEMNQRQRLGEILMMDKMMDKYLITRYIT